MGLTTLRNAFAAMLLLPMTAMVVQAQSPRMVLFEELSNASCGPCAAQNPTYHAYITQIPDRTIPISFRSYYPGRDVMHDEDSAMHNGRVRYYGNPGVPHLRMDGLTAPPSSGWYDGGAADTVAQSKYLATISTTSPISISVVETRDSNRVDLSVTVTSTEALSNKVVRVAAIEAHHFYTSAGGNGEKDFYNVVRKMFPSLDGTPITLDAGASKTLTFSYTIDPTKWNPDQMYAVAFVQDDASKEVLQAATSTQRPMLKFNVNGSPVVLQNDPIARAWVGSVVTNVSGQYTVTIDKKLPGGWDGAVTIGGTTVTNGQKISITGGTDAAISALITPSSTRAGSGRLTVELSNGHQEVSKTFRLFSGKADIAMLVRDEGRAEIADRYDEALSKNAPSYVILDAGVEPLFDLTSFKAVIIESGKNVFTQSEAQLIRTYLDGGGRLLLAGAEISWGMVDTAAQSSGYYRDPAFVTNYLHARYLADGSATLTTVVGVAGDPVTNGLNTRINTGVNNQDTPDEFAPMGNALKICSYNDGKGAGLRYADSTYRLVYFGFGMEGIGDATQRASLLDKSITWLLGSDVTVAGVGNAVAGSGLSVAVMPNPAHGMVAIPVSVPRAMHAVVSIVDMTGRTIGTIAERELETGSTTLHFDASGLANGVYAVVVETPAGRASTMMTVTR